MKKEKIVLSFIAVLLGLMVAGATFYLYQSTKVVSQPQKQQQTTASPSQAPQSSLFLTIDSPADEEVVGKKTVTIIGKTVPDAVVIISTGIGDNVLIPASTGNFTGTITIENGVNEITARAIVPNGQSVKIVKTLTFSTENF